MKVLDILKMALIAVIMFSASASAQDYCECAPVLPADRVMVSVPVRLVSQVQQVAPAPVVLPSEQAAVQATTGAVYGAVQVVVPMRTYAVRSSACAVQAVSSCGSSTTYYESSYSAGACSSGEAAAPRRGFFKRLFGGRRGAGGCG